MRPHQLGRASRVLVLCDSGSDATNAIVQALQRRKQFEIRTAHNTEEALNLLGGARWEIVFWRPHGRVLPGVDGLREIRRRQPAAAIVAVVTPSEIDAATQALANGATSYLVLGPHTGIALDAVLHNALALIAAEARAQRAEDLARRLEVRLRAISNLCQEAILVTTPSGAIIEVNRAAEQTLGCSTAEAIGRQAADLLGPVGLFDRLRAALANPNELGQLAEWGGAAVATPLGPAIIGVEGFVRQKSGAYVLRNISATAIRDDKGRIVEIFLTLADVPRERWLSKELTASNRILDLLLNSVSDAVALVDPGGIITKANRSLAELVGADDPQACVGADIDELVNAGGRLAALVQEAAARRGAASAQVELGEGQAQLAEATVAAICHEDAVTGAVVALSVSSATPPTDLHLLYVQRTGLVAALRCLEAIARARNRDNAVGALAAMAEWAARAMGAEVAAAVLLSLPDGPLSGTFGLPEDIGKRIARAVVAAADRAAGSSSPIVVIEDLSAYLPKAEDKQLVSTLLATGLRSCALLPLAISDQLAGAVFVAASPPRQFNALPAAQVRLASVQLLAVMLALGQKLTAVAYENQAQLIAEAAAEIGNTESTTEVLTVASRAVQRLFRAEWAAVHLLDRDGEEIEDSAMATAGGQVTTGAAMPAPCHALLWDAIRGARLLVRRCRQGKTDLQAAAIRIRADGELVGGLVVAWPGEREVTEADHKILQQIARHIGVALKRIRLCEEQASRRSEMEVAAAEALDFEARARSLLQAAAAAAELTELDEILAALAETALRTVGLDEVSLFLADHRARELRGAVRASVDGVAELFEEVVPLRRGESVYADAALSEAPYLVVPVQQEGSVSELALVPLRTRSALVGLLAGSKRLSGREITPQDLRLLRALGSIAAVVIDRARVDQLRETMAHSISHELRAPVASIRAYTELVLDEGAGPINEEQRTFLSRAVSVCEYLEQLIEDLLELSKLRAGEIRLHPEPVDLRELLEQIIDSLRPRIEEMDVEVTIRVPADAAQLYIDRMRLAQILTNLIDNAVKFNYQGGKVEVEAQRNNGEIIISVSDTGPGIAPEEREAIFQEFYRGKGQAAQARTGAGLGLAIAKRLAELLGGDITVESQVGRGSTFSLHLPFRLPADASPSAGGRLEVTAGGPSERHEGTDN